MKKILIAVLAVATLVSCWHRKSQEELDAEQSSRDYIRFLLRSTNERIERINDKIRDINAQWTAAGDGERYPEILDMQIDTLMFTGDLDKLQGRKLQERRKAVMSICDELKKFCDIYNDL